MIELLLQSLQRWPREAGILRFLTDLHVHSVLSDGELHPFEVVRRAGAARISRLAIADHESVGAYRLEDGAIFGIAEALGVTLVSAIEIDAEIHGHEVHMLGHGIDVHNAELAEHCARIQALREARTHEELEQANALLPAANLDPQEVFAAPRQTFMRPNLIMPLLDRGVFPTYEAAAAWFRRNVKPQTTLPRLTVDAAIRLIHVAGGSAVLAHPAYGVLDGWLALETGLQAFANIGLDGVEVDYPYARCSPDRFDAADEAAMLSRIAEAAQRANLTASVGSDSHRAREFAERWAMERIP